MHPTGMHPNGLPPHAIQPHGMGGMAGAGAMNGMMGGAPMNGTPGTAIQMWNGAAVNGSVDPVDCPEPSFETAFAAEAAKLQAEASQLALPAAAGQVVAPPN